MSNYSISRKPIRDGSDVELLHQDSARISALSAAVPEYSRFSAPDNGNLPNSTTDELFVQGWPTSSSVLKKQSQSWISLLVDLLVLISTLPFFALAISVHRVRGKGVDQHDWNIYQNATRVAATVFPIVFAAVFGRLVTKAASWKLERGSSLGTLEQLMGSRTVFSTLVTQFNLRAFNLIGICLAILWLLSPLGGQSALRIIETRYKHVASVSDVVQFDTNAPSLLADWVISSPASQGAVQSLFVPLNAMYSASLLTPSNMKLSSMDLWGNVKIPYLSSYQQSPGSAWTNVSSVNNPPAVYSSLIGIPTYNIPTGNSSFLIESSYLDLQCSNITTTYQLQPLNSSLLDKAALCGDYLECPKIANGTFQGYLSSNDTTKSSTWSIALDTFVSEEFWGEGTYSTPTNLSDRPDIPSTQATLLFQSYNVEAQMYTGPRINYTHAYCGVKTAYVESRVECSTSQYSSKNCSVVAQRESQLTHAPSDITFLSWPRTFRWISSSLPLANQAHGAGGTSDLALYHIQNASDSVANTVSYAHLDGIPEEEFSQRLGQVLNSYLMLSQAYTLVTGGTYQEFLFLNGNPDYGTNITRNITTSATNTTLEEIYLVSALWLTLFVLPTFVLLLAAIASVVFSHMTTSPEILGSCSLMVRGSRYVQMPDGGGTIDGVDMARFLRDLPVRTGEVERTGDGVGILGVGLKERVGKVVVGRRYL